MRYWERVFVAKRRFCFPIVNKYSRKRPRAQSQRGFAHLCVALAFLLAGSAEFSSAQTTYHLHDDSSGIQLLTTGPDTAAVGILSQDIKNLSPGDFIIAQFPTPSGVPGTAGVILSGSTITFNLWMSTTSTKVSSFPEARLYVHSSSFTQLCSTTGTTALTTTLTKYSLSCTTSTNFSLSTSDTFLLWVGIHTATKSTSSLQGKVEVEGTLNGNFDSTIVAPAIIPPPSISSLSLTSGTPGTAVTITGSNFGSPQGSSTVTFAGTTANVTSWAAGSIGVTVPAAVTGNVVVTVNGQASDGVPFTVPAPTITSVSPTSGRYGTAVTIAGSSFGSNQAAGSSTVTFGGTAATPTSWSDGSIGVPVPTGAAGGVVAITVKVGAQSTSANFTVIPPPSITTLSPNSGPINTTVTVSGSGFGSPQGSSTITFNGIAATPFSWGPGSIIVPVPAGTTTGSVVVTVAGQGSSGVTFTVTGGPSINTNGLTPSSGSAGTTVAIAGSNFGSTQGSSVVKFNGLAAKISSWGTGTINAIAPTGVTTGPVTVTVSGQTSNGVTFTAITNGTLSGTVTNSNSVAIFGATIQALQNGVSKASATTASNGTYSIANLAAGRYDIQASASTFGTALQNAVSVTANQTTTQNFTLSTPGSIGGKVTQSDGVTAISGAAVQVFVGSAVASSTTTDSGGNYSVANLNAGSYRAQASSTGFVTKSQTVSVSAGSNATANFSLQAPGTAAIQYDYDELGRLVGVVDAAGDAASYQYDSVGNILSISRPASNQVSIISFTPRSGGVGTTVTINGMGFSATSSQDTVQFNGTTATVISATTTQITANVPSGATTGPIKVVAPNGTATSSANFTVGAANGLPTITSFTPNMGTVGTAVSITGTNFDSSIANNRLLFNIASAVTSSLTPPTQLGTSIPSTPPITDFNTPPNIPPATSGRISLSTPAGKTSSSQDFYIPFNAHSVSDIGWTGRFSLGGSQTTSIPAGKVGLLLFDGTWGQGLTIQLSGSSISNCTLYVFAPDGTKLGINNSNILSDCTSATTGPLAISTLPLNGTYTIGIENGSTTAGNLTIGTISDAQGSISIDGPQVAISTTVPNQDARLVFSAIAGQRIGVFVTNVTNPSASVQLINPSGAVQGIGVAIGSSPTGQTFFMDTQTLAKTGTYQLWVEHSGSSVGSETLQIKTVPLDVTATLAVPAAGATGPTTTVATPSSGQNAYLTFSGTAGQQLGFNISNASYSSPGCFWFMDNPSGSQVTSGQCTSSFVDPQTVRTLTLSGTYTIFINPQGASTGSSTWSINNDADVTGTIAIDGSAVTTGTTVAGQDARVSFSATGQRIVVYVTNVSNPGANINLLTPSGSNQGPGVFINNTPTGQTFFMDTQSLGTGTYQLWVQHSSTNIGNETLQISSVPADVSGSVTINGQAFSFTTVAGQNANITFSNPQSQSTTVQWTAGTYPSSPGCFMFVTGPSPSTSQVGSANCTGATGSLSLSNLATGTYNILVNPTGASTGGMTLTVTSP